MGDNEGEQVTGLRKCVEVRVNHFNRLYQEDDRAYVALTIRVVAFYPYFVNEEKNFDLMVEVTLEELKDNVHSL